MSDDVHEENEPATGDLDVGNTGGSGFTNGLTTKLALAVATFAAIGLTGSVWNTIVDNASAQEVIDGDEGVKKELRTELKMLTNVVAAEIEETKKHKGECEKGRMELRQLQQQHLLAQTESTVRAEEHIKSIDRDVESIKKTQEKILNKLEEM